MCRTPDGLVPLPRHVTIPKRVFMGDFNALPIFVRDEGRLTDEDVENAIKKSKR
jgi:hypothetical protein